MFAAHRQLLGALLPDPAAHRAWAGGWSPSNVAIVLLVGGGISCSPVGMLRDLADEQGKARVQLPAPSRARTCGAWARMRTSTARVLADRPTLQRLLAEGRTEALPPFLRRFCETGSVDACAVFAARPLVAAVRAAARLAARSSPPSAEQGEHVHGAAGHRARAAARRARHA